MTEPFLGEIKIVPYTFPPRGWAFCNGQILSIAQNSPLFSLLGTTYGGNGQTTFALPDLQGRVAIGTGFGPGLSPYDLGQVVGAETVTLSASQTAHQHPILGGAGTRDHGASGGMLVPGDIYNAGPASTTLAADAIGTAGGGQPVNKRKPSLGVNMVIALQGIFPQRN